jgi:CRP/FNR family transcriptional regulator, cyclic AMP receptor protein
MRPGDDGSGNRSTEVRERMDPARLEGLALFAELDDDERAEVAACVREVEVAAGDTVATQGDNAYEFFVIEAGEAEVRRGDEVIASLRQGEVFGETGVLMTGIRTASVVAVTPMRLVAMFSREFKLIESRMPGIAATLRATMRERVARTPLSRS